MKQGRSLITLVMVVLAAALTIYFGFYVFDTFNDPYTTTAAYHYTTLDSAKADGLLIREEQVFPGQAGIVDVTRGEGERVGVGQTVALVYRDSQAQADQAALEALEMEMELLSQAAADSGAAETAARLDEDIIQSLVALRASTALNNYNDLESQIMAVKSGVLKRSYTYGDGLTADDLAARRRALREDYNALKKQAASATTQVRARQSGTFSTLVDGYEGALTPQTALQLTPSQLQALMAGGGQVDSGAVGKLITSNHWLFAAALPSETAQRLRVGDTALLRFSGEFSQDVEMKVEHLSAPEGEQTLAVFSSDRYLSRTTLLRRQTAELIFESWSGLRVPKGAVHMVKTAREDPQTGETTEISRLGVYVLVGGRAEFKAVEVVTEGADYYIVRGLATGSRALRAGDEIILNALGLYDGQLLEY